MANRYSIRYFRGHQIYPQEGLVAHQILAYRKCLFTVEQFLGQPDPDPFPTADHANYKPPGPYTRVEFVGALEAELASFVSGVRARDNFPCFYCLRNWSSLVLAREGADAGGARDALILCYRRLMGHYDGADPGEWLSTVITSMSTVLGIKPEHVVLLQGIASAAAHSEQEEPQEPEDPEEPHDETISFPQYVPYGRQGEAMKLNGWNDVMEFIHDMDRVRNDYADTIGRLENEIDGLRVNEGADSFVTLEGKQSQEDDEIDEIDDAVVDIAQGGDPFRTPNDKKPRDSVTPKTENKSGGENKVHDELTEETRRFKWSRKFPFIKKVQQNND